MLSKFIFLSIKRDDYIRRKEKIRVEIERGAKIVPGKRKYNR